METSDDQPSSSFACHQRYLAKGAEALMARLLARSEGSNISEAVFHSVALAASSLVSCRQVATLGP